MSAPTGIGRSLVLVAWIVVALCPLGRAGRGADAALRESQVRRWALAPDTYQAELAAVLSGSEPRAWPQRVAALDACVRALRVGEPLPPAVRTALQPWPRQLDARQPNEIATFCRLAALGGLEPVRLDPEVVAALGAHSLPAVREAFAELAASSGLLGSDATLATLAMLVRDRDPRVARQARASAFVCGLPPDAWEGSRMSSLASVGGASEQALVDRPERALEALVELALELERASVEPGWLRAWYAQPARAGLFGEPLTTERTAADALVELVELRVGAPLAELDLETLVAGWPTLARSGRARPFGERALSRAGRPLAQRFLDAYRALLAGGSPSVDDASQEVRGWALLEAALACAEGTQVVALAADDELVLLPLLGAIAGRDRELDPEALTRAIEPQRAIELRRAAQSLLSSAVVVRHDPAAGALLVRMLEDPEVDIREQAFAALVHAADPSSYEEALAAHLERLSPGALRRVLGQLPRRAWPAFDEVLLAAGESDRAARANLAELLAARRGDARVAAALESWLGQACDAAPGFPEPTEGDRGAGEQAKREEAARAALFVRAERLSRALVGVPRASAVLERTARMFGPSSEDIGKQALGALAGSAAGRARLPAFLDVERFGSRLAIEAALGLTAEESDSGLRARAVELLVERFASCDGELRERIVAAFGRLVDEDSASFLKQLYDDPTLAAHERLGAIGARLARPGPGAELWPDVRRHLVAADHEFARGLLALVGAQEGSRATATLAALGLFLAGGVPAEQDFPELAGRQRTALSGLREDVWIALADRALRAQEGELDEPLSARLSRALWEQPLAAARGDLALRQAGRELARTHFRWRGELALAPVVLRSAPADLAWWTVDGRLLVALADALGRGRLRAPGVALELACTGAVALDGEAPGRERDEARLAADTILLASCEQAEDWERYARLCERLGHDWRMGRLPRASAASAFGRYDAVLGVAPQARLASGALQARALAAWRSGARERAQRLLEQAAELASESRDALEAQRELERRFSGEGQR